jgi:hypothetical protein
VSFPWTDEHDVGLCKPTIHEPTRSGRRVPHDAAR